MTRLPLSIPCQGGRMYLMRSPKKREFVSPISCPSGSVVVVECQDDHQKMKGFLTRHGFWGFVPHSMCSGGATHIVAMWCVLTSGVNAPFVWLLVFPLNFSFLCLVFKLPFFPLSPSLFPTLNHCFVLLLLQYVLAIFFELLHYVVASFEVCLSFPFSFAFLCHR